MSSYYINKSLKGNSIISNLNVENSFITNTNITTELSSTYDIGSSSKTFRHGYFENLTIQNQSLANYTKSLFTSNAPISITDGLITLNYDTDKLQILGNQLTINDTYTKSLFLATAPIVNTNGNLSLTIDTAQFSIEENKLSLDYTTPFAFYTSGLELKYNTNNFNLNNDELTHKITNPFNYTSDGLKLKLKQTLNTTGQTLNKLFITDAGDLDVNLDGLIIAGNGISKKTYIESITDLGLSYIPGIGDIIPELVFISTSIDTENLDYKTGRISIKSLGQSRIPYYNAFKLTSESTFLYDDASNELSVNRIVLNDTVDVNSNNNRATTKSYVDNLNTYASNSALFYTQASGDSTREWDIRLNTLYLGLDADEKLITKITGAEGRAISVTPENEIIISYDVKHFSEVASKLTSKLTTVANGCINLTPDYELELDFNISHFSLVAGKLTSSLITKTGSCLVLDANYDLDINTNATDFTITTGVLNLSTAFKNRVSTAETKITTLEGKMTTAETNITNIQGRLTTAEGTITTHGTTLTTHTGQITALQGQIGGAIGAGVGGGIVGAVGGAAAGVLGAAGTAVSGIGSAALAGLAGVGATLLGVGLGVLITQDEEPDENGNPTYSTTTTGTLTTTSIKIKGTTSGEITFLGQADAGTYNFNLPITSGSSGQVLTSGGGGSTAMTWATPITSVALSVPSFLSISNSPLTANGTLAIGFSGTALPIINGGTGSTTSTGTGSVVLQNSPSFTGTVDIGTTTSINASNGSLNVLGSNIRSFTRTFTTALNQVADIFSYNGGVGTANFEINIITGQTNSSYSATYKISNRHNSTANNWRRCIPYSYSTFATDAYELQMLTSNGNTRFRLVHSVNTIASQVSINVITSYTVNELGTFTNLTANATYTDANWATYAFLATTAITQTNGQVGINTISPTATIDVIGSGKFSGLITGNGGLTITGSTTLGATTIGAITGTTATFSGLITGNGGLTITGSTTLASTTIGAITGTTANFSGLTASSAVATDASKNLVSVANTGTGDNVLQTAPTLISSLISTGAGSLRTALQCISPNDDNTFILIGTDISNSNKFGYIRFQEQVTFSTLRLGINYQSEIVFSTDGSWDLQSKLETDNCEMRGAINLTGTLGITGLLTASGGITSNTSVNNFGATTMSGDLAMGNFKITGLATPTLSTDATTKSYVDTAIVDAGTGLTKTGNLLSINTSQSGITSVGTLSSLNVTGLITGNGGLTITGSTTLGATTIGAITGTSATFSGLITGNGGLTITGSTTLGATTIGAITGTSATFSGLLTANGGLTITGSTALGATTIGAITGTSATLTGSCVFGPSASATSPYNISIRNSATQSLDIAISGGNTQYSTSSIQGDTVIRNYGGRLLLQNGAGAYALAISSNNTLVSGNLGVGTATVNAQIQLSNSIINRKLVLYETANNENQYYGFGINSGILRYQVEGTAQHHVFYAATSTTTSRELARISGSGELSITHSATGLSSNFLAPSIGNATNTGIWLGKALSTRNAVKYVYYHTADGSTSNRFSFDFWGQDNVITGTANGDVGINCIPTTGFRLDVNGASKMSSVLAEGSTSINRQGIHLQWNRSASNGEAWIINQKGGGSGGIRFGECDASNNLTETIRIDPAGSLRMNDKVIYLRGSADTNHGLNWNSSSDGPNLFGNAGGRLSTTANPILLWNNNEITTERRILCKSSNGGQNILFYPDGGGTNVGGITNNGANTAFNTTSDYRLKKNIKTIENSIETIKKIKPCNFDYKINDFNCDGFLAHELQEAGLDYCVFGEKDKKDKDGNDEIQMVDYSKLVPLLVASVQELIKEVEALRRELNLKK